MSSAIDAMMSKHQASRSARNLPAFIWNDKLGQAANNHTLRMAYVTGVGHDQWVEEIDATGFVYAIIGQNVGAVPGGVDQMYTAWMNSPDHKSNILQPRFTRIGIGTVTTSNGIHWWTVNFGGLV